MPYIIIRTANQETDHRELAGMLVMGRAPECDLVIRDIALSRRHCRLDETPEGWAIVDLGSKNGSTLNGQPLSGTPHPLTDMDVIRLGRSKIIFYAGVPDEDISERLLAPARPIDPHEALAGTVSGFTLVPAGENEIYEDLPQPQPEPKVPASLNGQELQELLTAIASSSWDSIYAEARQPAVMRPMPAPGEDQPRRHVARPRSPIDLSLQASDIAPPGESTDEAETKRDTTLYIKGRVPFSSGLFDDPEPGEQAPPIPVTPLPGQVISQRRWKHWFTRARSSQRRLGFVAAAVWLLVLALLGNSWHMLAKGFSSNKTTAMEYQSPRAQNRNRPRTINNQPASPAAMKTVPATQPADAPIYLDFPAFQQRLPGLLNTTPADALKPVTPLTAPVV